MLCVPTMYAWYAKLSFSLRTIFLCREKSSLWFPMSKNYLFGLCPKTKLNPSPLAAFRTLSKVSHTFITAARLL
jgi:hypothetical protein